MTKLFIQLMLSVILGVGAAMGLNPKVRADLHDTFLQANASLHETMRAALADANKVNAVPGTAVSAKANSGAFTSSSKKADLNLKNDLEAKLKAGDTLQVNRLPGSLVDQSLTTGVQTRLVVSQT